MEQNSRSFYEEAQEYDDLSKDPRLAEIFNRLNQRQTQDNLILQNQNEEETQNFKNYISKNYQKKGDKKNKQSAMGQSSRPLKAKDDEENENEEDNAQDAYSTPNKAVLDPDEEQKIEDHIKQFKVNSVQQYSILRHYFLHWHDICDKAKEIEIKRKKNGPLYTPADPSAIKGSGSTFPKDGNYLSAKMKNEKMVASPQKIQKEGIEPKSLDQKLQEKKKKKGGQKASKEGEIIHKISKSDILRFIPYCNDIVLPKKK